MPSSQDPRALLSKADALIAEVSGKSGGGFTGWAKGLILGKETIANKSQEAAELYNSAAIAFTNQRLDIEAAQAYERAAEASLQADHAHNGAAYYQNAWDRYNKEGQHREAIRCLEKSINVYATVQGNFSQAGKQQKVLAEFYEKANAKATREKRPVPYDPRLIFEAYQAGAENYDRGRSPKSGIPCSAKAAETLALMGELDRAAIVMDDTVEQSVQNEWIHTFEYMMKGALIHLATNDKITFDIALKHYCDLNRNFLNDTKYQIVLEFEKLYEKGNKDAWNRASERVSRLASVDEWTEKMLANIWTNLEQKPDDFS